MTSNPNTNSSGGGVGSKIKGAVQVVHGKPNIPFYSFLTITYHILSTGIGDNVRGTVMGAADTVASSQAGETKNDQLATKGRAEIAEGMAKIKGQVPPTGTGVGTGAGVGVPGQQGYGNAGTGAAAGATGYGGTGTTGAGGYGGPGTTAGVDAGAPGTGYGGAGGAQPGQTQTQTQNHHYGRDTAAGVGAAGLGAGAVHEYDKHERKQDPNVGAAQTGNHDDQYIQSAYDRTRQGAQPGNVGAAQSGQRDDQYAQGATDRTRTGGQQDQGGHHYGRDVAAGVGAAGVGAGAVHEYDKHERKQDPGVSAAQSGRHDDQYIQTAYDRTRQGAQPGDVGAAQSGQHDDQYVQSAYDNTRNAGQDVQGQTRTGNQDQTRSTTGSQQAQNDHHYGRDAAAGVGAAGLGAGAVHEFDKHKQQKQDPSVSAAQSGQHDDQYVQSAYDRTRQGSQPGNVGASQNGQHDDQYVQSGYEETRQGGQGVGSGRRDGYGQSAGGNETQGQDTRSGQQHLQGPGGGQGAAGNERRGDKDRFDTGYDQQGSQQRQGTQSSVQAGRQGSQGQYGGQQGGSDKNLPSVPGSNAQGQGFIGQGADAPQGPAPTVDLGYASYQGSVDTASNTTSFLGIRYAAPPVGDLRWAAPRPPATVSGVQKATEQPNECYQAPEGIASTNPLALSQRAVSQSEDCLYLNVYTPGDTVTPASSGEGLPVVVWIHGGGYIEGAASGFDGPFNGADLIVDSNYGVITVLIQYRLGVFGFLPGKAVKEGGVLNAGLRNGPAFQWVQAHIATFGGDPTKVTIWGESAGAGSVLQHLVAHAGNTQPPLFRAAMTSSMFLPSQYGYNERIPEMLYNEVATGANCTTLACLRAAPVDTLQTLNSEINLSGFYGTFVFVPVVDGTFIVERPTVTIGRGKLNADVLLSVTVTYEGTIFVDLPAVANTDVATYVSTLFPDLGPKQAMEAAEVYEATMLGASDDALAIGVMGNVTIFVCPTYYLLEAFGSRAWKGEFAIPPGEHGNDVAYYFTSRGPPFNNSQFITAFSGGFMSLVTSLDVNQKVYADDITPQWDAWTVDGRAEMLFNKTEAGAPVVKPTTTDAGVLELCA
ncbi:alpha/beta-hydrolase [Leucogyrophana mollusca]|uniref:Alpha/beta-hydrolase n=1 Tax=Leucogyrophana mollusca TaxID=85980 RepID=A0ACB8B4G8_9AGAM|nr:alpha/beta-hydrolase [Leucogyrophana mollusca]